MMFPPSLSAPLQDGIRFLPDLLPPGDFGVTFVSLTVHFGTDPMRFTMFRRQPLTQVFRCPDFRGSARNCGPVTPEH